MYRRRLFLSVLALVHIVCTDENFSAQNDKTQELKITLSETGNKAVHRRTFRFTIRNSEKLAVLMPRQPSAAGKEIGTLRLEILQAADGQ